MTTAVSFQNVSRHFGPVRAVDDVTLDIAPGEFFAMLGPSGSGKTTCLRLIAGFEQPTGGHIEIFGETAEGLSSSRALTPGGPRSFPAASASGSLSLARW
jgi:putative spermidine/putrescine transport system ATP-binding protein